jgi:hypothetical protein
MTKKQIITAATSSNASDFIEMLDRKKVSFYVLDQDNIMDPDDGILNIAVEGMPDGEALLFDDGEFCR